MSDTQIVYTCIDGTIGESDQDVVAKYHTLSNKSVYYIRFENGKMVNPSNRDNRRKTLEQARWKRVPHNVYILYLQFLKTHRQMFLLKAEREYHE